MAEDNRKTPSEVLAETLPKIRSRQGLSAEAFAAGVRSHGGQLDRAAISKIENELRGVSLDEAFVIAAALGVSPLHLFLPREDDALVAVTPAAAIDAATVRQWVRGTKPLPVPGFDDDRVYRTEVPASEWAAKSAQLVRAEDRVRETHHQLRVAKELARTITADLAELDRRHPPLVGLGNWPSTTPEAEQKRRLERRLEVAYDRVAEATVEADDAVRELHAIRREMQADGGEV